jgi:hypothetical protein
VLALLSVLVLVLTLLLLLSVSVVAMLLVLPPSVVCELSTCADAAVLKPKAKAMADAMSVNFMKYSPDVECDDGPKPGLNCVAARRRST